MILYTQKLTTPDEDLMNQIKSICKKRKMGQKIKLI